MSQGKTPDECELLRGVVAVKPHEEIQTLQRLPYFLGISNRSVGSQGLSMHLVVLPPGASSEPHVHIGFETGIYVLQGRVKTLYGTNLEYEIVSEPGDFLYIAPGCPHKALNLDMETPARAIVARTGSSETEDTAPYEVG
jgi:uncharacterized RmlC-like cupin family protein